MAQIWGLSFPPLSPIDTYTGEYLRAFGSILFFTSIFIVTVLLHQNCSLYQSDGRKILDDGVTSGESGGSIKGSALSECQPYVIENMLIDIYGDAFDVTATTETSPQPGFFLCDISVAGVQRGLDFAACTISPTARDTVMNFIADPVSGVSNNTEPVECREGEDDVADCATLSGGDLTYIFYPTASGDPNDIFYFVEATDPTDGDVSGVSCQLIFEATDWPTNIKADAKDRAGRLVKRILEQLISSGNPP